LVTSLWSITAPGRFLIREWDGECVVFDLLSNDTHACDALTTAAIRQLNSGPSSLGLLAHAVAAVLGRQGDAEFTALTTVALNHLERFGIVERVMP
jgi:PqqD family protein of HPr-rel-A system